MDIDPDDISSNPSNNRPFREVIAAHLSRRNVLRGAVAAAATGFLGAGVTTGTAAADDQLRSRRPGGPGRPGDGPGPASLLGFEPVPASSADKVTVPRGYKADVLIPWGTPLRTNGPAWRKDATNTAADQAQQIGTHHDGMHFFPFSDTRGLLVVNHEYVDIALLFSHAGTQMTPDDVEKALNAHGVSVVEIAVRRGRWVRINSWYNRRITPSTPMVFSGPVPRNHPALQSNNPVMGTLNNCSHGVTPWGTYLACEENWNLYFSTSEPGWSPTPAQARYGLSATGLGIGLHQLYPRLDIGTNPNEANRFGWVVEIDQKNPNSTPVKRTALGRFKHEGAVVTEVGGRVVVYSGDDQDGDYIYRYVSKEPWRDLRDRGLSPLDHGTLYVAHFADNGTGQWRPLVHGVGPLTTANGWKDQADVLLRTRQAADAVGATPLDRPEWIAVHPTTGKVYATLTHGRGWPGAVTPRTPNPYGHIIGWTEGAYRGGNATTSFDWDIFLLAGDPAYDSTVELDADGIFGSPDGLVFDKDGRMWIHTDVDNDALLDPDRGYDNIGNNALLAADPDSGEVRRFLVGPRGAEISGATFTPNGRTMFVNIQHPGEATAMIGRPTAANPRAVSNWPDFDPAGRPRSATVVIRKTDGGVIGT